MEKLPAERPGGAWRGVSFGGWLLLEPGPSDALFGKHLDENKEEARCEWDLMKMLREKDALDDLKQHRETHITKEDFVKVKNYNLNAIRLPFGYWCVLGPRAGEPYDGPCLEYIDRAVDWAEEVGLQIVLDLHGCPGGESPEAPCGHRQRPYGTWSWRQWRIESSLVALKKVAERYRNRACVTGIAVCNEPSPEIPLSRLLHYYDRAVDTVRGAGMHESRVSVVLPIFQRDYDKLWEVWARLTKNRHENYCFEDHFYHCFDHWNSFTLAQQLREVQRNCEELRKYPMVVGEWSLALGAGSWGTPLTESEARQRFGRMQLEAYKQASHGWFFWCWKDGRGSEWDWQQSFEEGSLSGPAPQLPEWNGNGDDPLEEELDPSPPDAIIRYGDPMYIRAFHGCYCDVEQSSVQARWPDKGSWQVMRLQPASNVATTGGKRGQASRQVRTGDRVEILAHTGRPLICLPSENGEIRADGRRAARFREFELLIEDKKPLRHRSRIFFRSVTTGRVLDADPDDEVIAARWTDFGDWQRFVVEKADPSSLPKQLQKSEDSDDTTPSRKRLYTKGGSSGTLSPVKAQRRLQQHPSEPSGGACGSEAEG
mmetsp:Transcript_25572/g.59535  ORF Transcript_25572/g.59535 Transcript_25572/m.59535 type:complete len:597 (+) Transcript_25572:148-1938(+)